MTLPAPLPAEREPLVVVEVLDGHADTTIVHLPALRAVESGAGGPLFTRYEWPPAVWPSACRRVRAGSVYVHGGVLAGVPVCADCEAAA